MKIHTYISRLQDLNAYGGEYSPDTPGQEILPLSHG